MGSIARPGRLGSIDTVRTDEGTPADDCDHGRTALPSPRRVVGHAWPAVVEGSAVPFALFAIAVRWAGLWTALVVALGWSVGALARRLWRGHRVPGILVLGTLTLAVRTLIALVSGNLDVYFVPPLLSTVALAGAFVASVPLRRPLAWKLANDLWPMPAHAQGHPTTQPVFRRLCWFWAAVNVSKAVVNMWMLSAFPVATYAVLKGAVSAALMGGGVVVSYMWLRGPLAALPARLEGCHRCSVGNLAVAG